MITQMATQKESADYHLFYESIGHTEEFCSTPKIHPIPNPSPSEDDEATLKIDFDASTA
jgi:amino acid permease